jgi:hypothetical protein
MSIAIEKSLTHRFLNPASFDNYPYDEPSRYCLNPSKSFPSQVYASSF